MLKIAVILLGLLASPIAGAHGLQGVSFMHGLAHPLLGLDHLLAMLAMGVSVAAFSTSGRWLTASLMILSLLVGLFSASAAHLSLSVDSLLAATLFSLGLMLVRKHALTAPLHAALIVLFTFFHGFAHGIELPFQDTLWPLAAGVVGASLLLFGLGIGVGRIFVLRQRCAQIGLGGMLGSAAWWYFFAA